MRKGRAVKNEEIRTEARRQAGRLVGWQVSSDEVQNYLPSHTDQRSTLKSSIGWRVLEVYLDGLKRCLVVNTFKLHQ